MSTFLKKDFDIKALPSTKVGGSCSFVEVDILFLSEVRTVLCKVTYCLTDTADIGCGTVYCLVLVYSTAGLADYSVGTFFGDVSGFSAVLANLGTFLC